MSEIVLRRIPSHIIACFDVSQWERGDISLGLRDKSADVCPAHMVGWVGLSRDHTRHLAGASGGNTNEISTRDAIALVETFVLPS
jgi:hypothetical protein